jgi:hypothetical protein
MLDPGLPQCKIESNPALAWYLGKALRLYQNGENDCNIFTLEARRQKQEQEKHISLF